MYFFFNDTATTEIYTLSLHDALPIWVGDQIVEAIRAHRDVSKAQARDRAVEMLGLVGIPEPRRRARSEEHTSELQSRLYLLCRLLLERNALLGIALACCGDDSC